MYPLARDGVNERWNHAAGPRVSQCMKRGSALLLLLSACTPVRPQVMLEPGASLKGYRVFVVGPVTDETGSRFNLNVTDSLRTQLAARLRSHGLTVAAAPPPDTTVAALLVTSALEGFRGMPFTLQLEGPGVTGCTLRSELRDAHTGRRIGEIVASVLEERIRPMWALVECAHDVADAIQRQLRP